MVLNFLSCLRSCTSIVDQASALTHIHSHCSEMYLWYALDPWVVCTTFLWQVVYAQSLCLLGVMPVLLLSHLPCSEHSANIGSHFYQFGTYGKLDPGKPCIVSWLNMCYLHFWTRVCNQHEGQFCHSQRFLEVPSKTLAHSSTVPTLQDSVIILVDTLDPEHIL